MNTLKCRIGQLFCLLFVSVSKRDTEPDAEPAPDPNVPKREKSAEAPSIPEWPGVKRPESAVSVSVHTRFLLFDSVCVSIASETICQNGQNRNG